MVVDSMFTKCCSKVNCFQSELNATPCSLNSRAVDCFQSELDMCSAFLTPYSLNAMSVNCFQSELNACSGFWTLVFLER